MLFDEVLELLSQRRSIRRFLNKPVAKEDIYRLLEAARWAPSATNRQEWEFVVVSSIAAKTEMAERVRARWDALLGRTESGIAESIREYSWTFDWFSEAPILIAVTTRKAAEYLGHMVGNAASSIAGNRISAAMAAQNLMLACHALGLGSCCLTGSLAAEEELKGILGLGKRREIVCLIAVGYPAEMPAAPHRKPVDEIVRFIE